jgi:hypothetical protein
MLRLSDKWAPELVSQPETGMGYQIASVILKNGMRYDQVVIESGVITQIRGLKEIPFREEDIAKILVTHEKWDFSKTGWT